MISSVLRRAADQGLRPAAEPNGRLTRSHPSARCNRTGGGDGELFRANPFDNTKLFTDANERNTIYSRVETLAQRNRLVGFSWSALKEAFYGEQADSLLLIDYDLLLQSPEKVLRLVYQFIGEP